MNPIPTSRLRLSVPVAALRWSVPDPSRVESASFRHTLAGSAFQFHFIIIISDVAELRLTRARHVHGQEGDTAAQSWRAQLSFWI